jgi:hypothetical protein
MTESLLETGLSETHGEIAPQSVNNALMLTRKFAASHDFFGVAVR